MRDTIDMAREAGFQTGKRDYADGNGAYPFVVSVSTGNFLVELKAFEALVRADERNRTWTQEHWTEYERSIAAAEREACAKLCDWLNVEKRLTPAGCAAAIRTRGQA
jgi:hypothetical protein